MSENAESIQMIYKAKQTIVYMLIATASLTAQKHVCVRNLVIPDYPALAWMARAQGKVVLDIQILADGHVAHVNASGGPRLLQSHAMRNIRKWTFGNFPEGSKFPIRHRIVYVYRLEGEPQSGNAPTYVFQLPDQLEIVANPPQQRW